MRQVSVWFVLLSAIVALAAAGGVHGYLNPVPRGDPASLRVISHAFSSLVHFGSIEHCAGTFSSTPTCWRISVRPIALSIFLFLLAVHCAWILWRRRRIR